MEPSGEASCKRVIDAIEALWNGDFSIEIDDVVVRGDTAMLHGTATGTFEGEFYGAPPTGRAMDLGWMARTIVDGGRVVDDRIYYDQKGCSPSSASPSPTSCSSSRGWPARRSAGYSEPGARLRSHRLHLSS